MSPGRKQFCDVGEINFGSLSPLPDPRVEAGSNTSTVALRVIEDEKRTQCLEGITGTLCSGENTYGDLALQVGEQRIWDSKIPS
jgi:hypothetical protein